MGLFASIITWLRQIYQVIRSSFKKSHADKEHLLKPLESIGNTKLQYLIVVRHALRKDEVDLKWINSAERPWDPPIADKGHNQAISISQLFHPYNIDYVVSSPFLRCLQTSVEILRGLGLNLNSLIIDCQLSEIYNPRTLAGTNKTKLMLPMEEWMWNGKQINDVIKEYMEKEFCFHEMDGVPMVLDNPMPTKVETIERGCSRYVKAIENLSNELFGYNLLLVSHGEAVRASINRLYPKYSIYETRHVGFTCASRHIYPSREIEGREPVDISECSTSTWKLLTKNGQTGVYWIA